ncbi:hypothetical protein D6V26_07170 [Vibrio cholerae]|nr:hypothetical protein [Vibrio cholerae]
MTAFFKKFELRLDNILCRVRTPNAREADGFTMSIVMGTVDNSRYTPIYDNPEQDLRMYYQVALDELANRIYLPEQYIIEDVTPTFIVKLYTSHLLNEMYQVNPNQAQGLKPYFKRIGRLFKQHRGKWNGNTYQSGKFYFDVEYEGLADRFI